MENDRDAASGDLPCGFRARETTADYSDAARAAAVNSQFPTPNSQSTPNSQTPNPKRTPNPNFQGSSFWELGVGSWELVGNWELGVDASQPQAVVNSSA